MRLFLEHASDVSTNATNGKIDKDDNIDIPNLTFPFYNQIKIAVPSPPPEMNALLPEKQTNELAFNNKQNILIENKTFRTDDKISNYFPKVSTSAFISSNLYTPRNSSHIIYPQNSITKHNSVIPYTYNNIINEINTPDHLSFANKINNEFQGDAPTNKNNRSHLFHGKQTFCCVCRVKITR